MNIIDRAAKYVKNELEGEGSGHDWWHIYRVWQLSKKICDDEKADRHIVELAALLHDIADWKFHGGDETAGPRKARKWLETNHEQPAIVDHVCEIIKELSFKGAGVKTPMRTMEGMVVQDADRLDAMGAMGIARAFAYGGFIHQEMHNPTVKLEQHSTFEAYKKRKTTTINHFYEKLLLLKDSLNTKSARLIAEERHRFMELYLERFFKEWDGST